jgi:hypothetical protein
MLRDESGAGFGVGHGHELADVSDGHSQLPEALDHLRGGHLVEALVAVATLGVDLVGFEQAGLVVAAKGLDGKVGDPGELPDAQSGSHGTSVDSPPWRGSSEASLTPCRKGS